MFYIRSIYVEYLIRKIWIKFDRLFSLHDRLSDLLDDKNFDPTKYRTLNIIKHISEVFGKKGEIWET